MNMSHTTCLALHLSQHKLTFLPPKLQPLPNRGIRIQNSRRNAFLGTYAPPALSKQQHIRRRVWESHFPLSILMFLHTLPRLSEEKSSKWTDAQGSSLSSVSSSVRLELRAIGGLEDRPVRCGLEVLPVVSTLELLAIGIGLELRADTFDLARGGGFFTGVAVMRVIAGVAQDWED